MRHWWQRFLLVFVFVALAGCVVPDYYTPGGFSSTYHKRVYGTETEFAVPVERPSVEQSETVLPDVQK